MRTWKRKLGGVALVLLALPALAMGQSPTAEKSGPAVIATTKASAAGDTPAPVESERPLPLPDDGLPLIPFPQVETTSAARAPVTTQAEKRNASESEGRPGSALSVEIQGPASITPGQPFVCHLTARNQGRDTLTGVWIDLSLPTGVRIVSSDPAPEQSGVLLRWSIGQLPAEGQRRLRVELSTEQTAGEVLLAPRIGYAVALTQTNQTPVMQRELKPAPTPAAENKPDLALDVSGPRTAAVGEQVVLTIRLHNFGRSAVSHAGIRCQLAAGLKHSAGELLEADVLALGAGDQKTIQLQLEAASAGPWTVEVTATTDRHPGGNGQTVTARHAVTVGEAAPSVREAAPGVRIDGPRQGAPGRELSYRVEVSNPGKSAVPNAKLRLILPEGLQFVASAPKPADEPPGSPPGTVWKLGDMPAEQKTEVTFQVRAKQVGEWTLPVTLNGDGMAEVRTTHAVRIDDAPSLVLDATADTATIDAGREAVFEFRITNQGTSPARGVALTVKLPDHLAAVQFDGPTKPGQQTPLTFEPLPQLNPRAAAVYRLKVRGLKAGAGRVHVAVNAAGLAQPVQRELTSQVRGATP